MGSARELSVAVPPIGGRYELLDKLGEGGMGVVYRAQDRKTGSYVALKKIKDISDPLAVELFHKEWKVLAEMCHPNIVDVRDAGVVDEDGEEKPYFVMPLLQGTTLAELIKDASARLTVARVVEIMTQVCKGLQAAHQRGLVHRDLKPSNIFVMDDDTAKIIDFGVVHLAGTHSVTGQKGTWQYMSPEQVEAKPCTPASDIFSLGVVCYEALTSRKPFARKTVDETIDAIRRYVPPPVSEVNPNVNQLLSMVVHKCLAKQPIHRFSSARDLAETLQKAYRNEAIERFDRAKIQPRIERARAALKEGDEAFASEILAEIEAEGHLDPEITVLRTQIDTTTRQKKIRQLLESARARLEQDEIPLALDKLREVLDLDPENTDALALRREIEKQKDQRQISKWLDLARQHLERRDFNAARQATQEVLALKSDHREALDLLAEIESTEQQAKHVRQQKEQLYTSAVKAYQNGEIDSALSKLERILSLARQSPEAAVPERDAVYQSFFNQVRTERDTLHNAYEEARRQFTEKNFAKAIELCEELLTQHPNDALFQALKLEAVEADRQELSAYTAALGIRLDKEPDLDRRVSILREAVERYPNEPQFANQLKLVRERRDLVNSIVAKARLYEERNQFAEAIGQWDILRNIYPQYPGIDFELQQLKKRKEQQALDEEKERLVEDIEQLIQAGAHGRAIEQVKVALQQFPGDAELQALQHMAQEALERSREARTLFEAGQRACAEKDFIGASDSLRQAMRLEPRNTTYREALIHALVEQARIVVEQDWTQAEPILDEAGEIDAAHSAVRSMRATIADVKRKQIVGQCLAEARELQGKGDIEHALARVRAARAQYPTEQRLEAFEAQLVGSLKGAQQESERKRDRATLEEYRRKFEQETDVDLRKTMLHESIVLRRKYSDDPQIAAVVAELQEKAKNDPRASELSEVLQLSVVSDKGGAAPAPAKQPQKSDAELPVIKPEEAKPQLPVPVRPTRSLNELVLRYRTATAIGVILLLGVVAILVLRHHRPNPQPVTTFVAHISTTPADAIVRVNGRQLSERSVNVAAHATNSVEVSHLGYKSKTLQVPSEGQWNFVLEPEPTHLRVLTALPSGSVDLDGNTIGQLTGGALADYELPADTNTHTLTIHGPSSAPTFSFASQPGAAAKVSAISGEKLLVITVLGNDAAAYSSATLSNVTLAGRALSPITPSGIAVPLTGGDRELVVIDGTEETRIGIENSNAPVILVRTTGAPIVNGTLVITCEAPNAVLAIDGKPMKGHHSWQIVKPAGTYNITISAPGYAAKSFSEQVKAGDNVSKTITLDAVITTGVLSISNGTPQAEVLIGGAKAGDLDANGSGRFDVPFGTATVTLRRQYFEPRSFEVSASAKSPEVKLSDAKLVAFGTLNLSLAQKNVHVRYRNVNDQQFTAYTSGPVHLKQGQYEIQGEATGYQPQKRIVTISPGQNLTLPIDLPLNPPSTPDGMMQNPKAVTVVNGAWLKAKDAGEYLALLPSLRHVNLVFTKDATGFLKRAKKVHWTVEAPDGARLMYELEDRHLTRKVVAGNKDVDQKSANVDATSASVKSVYSVRVHVDPGHVRVMNDAGVVLDDYASSEHDFGSGKIAVRAETLFYVRND